MADDISKNITIGVEMDTDKLTQNITSLNKLIDSLVAKQQQLTTAGQQSSTAFDNVSAKLGALQKKLQDATTQVTANATAMNALSTSNKAAEGSLSSLTAQHQQNTKAVGDSAVKIKELSGQISSLGTANKTTEGSLSSLITRHQQNTKAVGDSTAKIKDLSSQITALDQSVKQQSSNAGRGKNALDAYAESITKGVTSTGQLQGAANTTSSVLGEQVMLVNNSKTAFDAHKTTLDHLKTSFDEIKDVSGIFGPSLKEAAEGFNAMKTGLSIVQGGLKGVGDAIKADGFGFLLEILQKIVGYFTTTTTGSNMLKGAISAIGVVVNKVSKFLHSLMDGIIKAFSHPIETLKSLGKMIETNIINRFKAFSVILDGIIHLDFKKMANGAIQAITGVTDATGKIATAFTNVKNGVEGTAKQMVSAYKEGYDKAGKHVDDHEKKVTALINKQIEGYRGLKEKAQAAYAEQENRGKNDATPLDARSKGVPDISTDAPPVVPIGPTQIEEAKKTEDAIVKIKKTALQQVEDYAKQNAGKIAGDALNILNNSIKQQSGAKIAALEKDKAAELSNTSLTSAQKIAIEQKYKQHEGQVKIKAFKEEQEASIAQAVINGALAVTKGSSQMGVLAPLYIPIIIAETAVQVAKIAAQKPPAYAKGGLHYSSDGHGGVLPGYSKTDNTNAYLRSGEGVVVSEAMQVPWARNLVSAINVGFGGRDFSMTNPGRGYAVGGVFTDGGDANRYYNQPVTDQKNLANTIAYQMINNFPPVYVDVKDVNNQQNILAQTINRVNL